MPKPAFAEKPIALTEEAPRSRRDRAIIGKVLYGATFTVLVPSALALFASRLDGLGIIAWPLPAGPSAGWIAAATGAFLIVWSMALLMTVGQGLPMNAYPTRQWVRSGPYRVMDNPIYAGFVILVAGFSIVTGSASGFWLVTPLVGLGCLALVAGYEARATRQRLGSVMQPLLSLPSDLPAPASISVKMTAALLSFGPWASTYGILSVVPTSPYRIDVRMPWEMAIPASTGAIWISSLSSAAVVIAPLLLHTHARLRRFILSVWISSVLGFAAMILLPLKAAWLDASDLDRVTTGLLAANRFLGAEWLAMPSFRACWITMAAIVCWVRWPRSQSVVIVVAAIALWSCLANGQDAVAGLLAGAILAVLSWNHPLCWRTALRASERLSNAWSSARIGPVRIVHSGWLAALAAAVGIVLACVLAGPGSEVEIVSISMLSLIAAGAWGYTLEGGEKLARPFGYYGYLIGGIAALAVYGAVDLSRAGFIAAALATAGSFAHAVGRMRCMVQGCCHGRPAARDDAGIVVTNSKSRVVAHEGLSGVAIYPTQLYSLIANLLTGGILVGMWFNACSWSTTVGIYLVASSLTRFVEEGYRGEHQTAVVAGVPIYQWLSVGTLVLGMAIMCISSDALVPAGELSQDAILAAAGSAAVVFLFMGIDFPGSTKPLSRLAPR